MGNFKSLILCAGLIAGMASAASGASIQNGSFEQGVFNPPANETVSLAVGSTTMPGWEVIGDTIGWFGPGHPWGNLMPSDGDYFLDLTDYLPGTPYGGVKQTIATVIGTIYEVTFDLGSSTTYGTAAGIQAQAAGTTQDYAANNTGQTNLWESQSFTFTAVDSATVLSLIGIAGVTYAGLDNVAISAVGTVPVPASILLMLGALGGLGAVVQRRVKPV